MRVTRLLTVRAADFDPHDGTRQRRKPMTTRDRYALDAEAMPDRITLTTAGRRPRW